MLSHLILVLLLASFYSFWNLAIIAVTKGRVSRQKALAKRGFPGASLAGKILLRANDYILVCQIWALFSAVLAGFFLQRILTPELLLDLEQYFAINSGWQEVLLVVFIIVVLGVFVLTLVQVAKAIALPRPTRTLSLCAWVLVLFGALVSPIVKILRWVIDVALKALGVVVPGERELAPSAEELNELLEFSHRAGEIEKDEMQMIQRIFAFSESVVREVMTPRADIISIEESASFENLKRLFVRERVSRVLVTGANLDDVKGFALAKDLLKFAGRPVEGFKLRDFIRPAFFVSNSRHLDELLREFRREAAHYAVVLDEHGGVDGVVTQEDLMEEIVGEIFDEYDSPLEELDVFQTHSGDLVVDGMMLIDDINSAYHLDLPAGAYDTVAGFVMQLMGKIPASGESIAFQSYKFQIEGVHQNRITQIRISRN